MDEQRILVVDDDPLVLATYEAAFAGAGFNVKTESGATDAFAVLQVFKPDVVILDLNMPGAGGLAWLNAARQLPEFEDLPVVVVTAASPDSPEFTAAQVAGVQGVLHKKFWTPDSLVSAARWAAAHRGTSPLAHAA